MILINKNWL